MNKTIIIGISSGIAAYKIVDLIRILRNRGIHVEVIMTANAVAMFGKKMFEEAAGGKVYTDLIAKGFDYKQVLKDRIIEHINLADSASLFVIAPATANVIAKLALGLADDFLTTTLLATTAPILVCPSMNVHMWESSILQENLEKLKMRGFHILSPDRGQLACGYEGVGRLVAPEEIAEEIFQLLNRSEKLKGKKIIVTAGGTSEAIDAVRTITNRASGKMGTAIAEVCYMQGADVLLLRSVTAAGVNPRIDTSGVAGMQGFPRGGEIRIETFVTAKDLEVLIKKYAKDYDVIFHTAAVSDFIPEKKVDTKLDSGKSFMLKLKPAAKILHQIRSWNRKILLIGFKAVYKLSEKELINAGIKKLKESKSDYIIVNDVGREGAGFSVDTNEVYIIHQAQGRALSVEKIPKAPKKEIARKILEYIL